MVGMYIISDNQVPVQKGESCADDDIKMIGMMKAAQLYDFNQPKRIITWIVYRPEKAIIA